MSVRAHNRPFALGIAAGAVLAVLLWTHVAHAGPTGAPTTTPPAPSGALLRDGIFGCNASKYQNIGALSAIGGVYVPVNDAAVTLNTGYLVYKECILDGVVSKISEAARTELTGTILRQFNEGNKGRPRWPVSRGKEDWELRTAQFLADVEGGYLDTIPEHMRGPITTAIARTYSKRTTEPNQMFASTFPGSSADMEAFYKGQPGTFSWNRLLALGDWQNNPIGAFQLASESLGTRQALVSSYQSEELMWGRGAYAITDDAGNPLARQTLTPSFLVAESGLQAITSGFRCLEGGDELSEVCAPLFSGLTTQILAGSQGLSGITQAQNGLPSYVGRMVSEASSAVRQEAVNAALAILGTARQVEASFLAAKEATAGYLTTAIAQLRNAENACWNFIIPAVRTYAQQNGNPVLNISTSTQFSQAVIDSQIAPVATIVAQDLKNSEEALKQLDGLIAGVTNTASAAAQRQALEQLDQLVATGKLHTGTDVQNANKQRTDVEGAAKLLVEETLTIWGGGDPSPNPEVNWCNYQNQSVIQKWFNAWRQ